MHFSNHLKILIIGPEGEGKTTITNYLCGKSNVLDVPYRPTAGVRIIETEKDIKNKNYTIQMWDVSGSSRYDRGWAAIQKGAHGVIIVYNPDNSKSQNEVESWTDKFPKSIGIPTAQCVGFAHHLSQKNRDKKSKVPKGAGNMTIVDTSIQEGAQTLLPAFDSFLNSVITSLEKKRATDQNNLMNQ